MEDRITLPCTLNGQIASGEVNRYRFEARKGQRLVISTQARQLIPYIADAVPGWFQPVLALYDANGKEVAYDDDYRFKPDPVILYEVPKDGEYVLAIYDAIYRGREDFVYRITIGELPFVTSIFPLGGRAGEPVKVEMKGWNLEKAELTLPPSDAGPGIYSDRRLQQRGLVSNRVPFALDTLPECFEKEPNDDPAHAQKVKLPDHHQRAHRPPGRLGRVPVRGPCRRDDRRGSLRAPARFAAGFRAQAHRRRPASCWPSTTITTTRRRA